MSNTATIRSAQLSLAQQSNPETELRSIKAEYDLLEESQEVFHRTIRYRSCAAQTSSCACCLCTCLATAIPCILCYPCICYGLLNKKRDYLGKVMESIGCAFERAPQNRIELCCRNCTPIFVDFPDMNTSEGSDYFALPHEIADERARFGTMHRLSEQMNLHDLEPPTIQFPSHKELIPKREEMT